jgi:hypothetical protein
MADERRNERQTPACRWRTSAETLDLLEAIERIEAMLDRLEAGLRGPAPRAGDRAEPTEAADRPTGGARERRRQVL